MLSVRCTSNDRHKGHSVRRIIIIVSTIFTNLVNGSLIEGSIYVVYYESIKRKLKIKCIYECRCYERLQTKTKEFTHLTYTGLVVELEHLKIETESKKPE